MKKKIGQMPRHYIPGPRSGNINADKEQKRLLMAQLKRYFEATYLQALATKHTATQRLVVNSVKSKITWTYELGEDPEPRDLFEYTSVENWRPNQIEPEYPRQE